MESLGDKQRGEGTSYSHKRFQSDVLMPLQKKRAQGGRELFMHGGVWLLSPSKTACILFIYTYQKRQPFFFFFNQLLLFLFYRIFNCELQTDSRDSIDGILSDVNRSEERVNQLEDTNVSWHANCIMRLPLCHQYDVCEGATFHLIPFFLLDCFEDAVPPFCVFLHVNTLCAHFCTQNMKYSGQKMQCGTPLVLLCVCCWCHIVGFLSRRVGGCCSNTEIKCCGGHCHWLARFPLFLFPFELYVTGLLKCKNFD